MAKYCANCGRELPDEAMYCPDCGKEYVPRSKADFPENNDDLSESSSSDYEFNGPFGPSSKKFEGPFGPHSNRGNYDSKDLSSKKETNSPSEASSGNDSNKTSTSKSDSNFFKNNAFLKIIIILSILIVIFSLITSMMDGTLNSNNVLSDNANNQNIDGIGSIERNEPYNMSIDENTYLSGEGEVRLIDSNHSYNIESDEFNITEYETYYVNVDNDDWYVLDIFKCKFNTPAQSQVYSTDVDDGSPIIIYGGKDDYYGYGIILPNSSNNSKFKNLDFLESIFHYKKQ